MRTALARKVTQFGVVVIKSWADWARYEALGAKSPRFATIVAADAAEKDNGMKQQLLAELSGLSAVDQVDLMSQLIVEIVASVLKSESDSISVDRPINEMGIDSLMATEIQVLFETKLGISVSVLELIGDATIRSLAVSTIDGLQEELATSKPADKQDEPPAQPRPQTTVSS